MKLRSRFAAVTLAALGIPIFLSGPATAMPSASSAGGDVQTIRRISSECLSAVSTANAKLTASQQLSTKQCDRNITVSTSSPAVVSAAQVAADPSAPASLIAAAAAGTVYAKYFYDSIDQGTDVEVQEGTFYYDGTYSWATTYYRGYTGWHQCWVSYAVGYSIDITQCDDWGRQSGTNRERIGMTVHLLGSWFPVQWHEEYYIYMNKNGATWF
jgi:hypothetical protein